MAKNMKGKDLISLLDLTPEEIDQILDTASFLKRLHYMVSLSGLCKARPWG